MTKLSDFEKELKSVIKIEEPDGAYKNRLQTCLRERELNGVTVPQKTNLRWVYVAIPLLIVMAVILIAGPNKVLAQIKSWLGFVPGVGMVEKDAEIFTLQEPVVMTKDGVELQINEAWFTPEKSVVNYAFFNVPNPNFYPGMVLEQCYLPAWLETEDGTRYEEIKMGEFPGLPAGTAQVSLHVPCIWNTVLNNSAPQDWQASLNLTPSGDDLTIQDVHTMADALPEPQVVPVEILGRNALETRFEDLDNPIPLPKAEKIIENGVQIHNIIRDGDALVLTGTFSGAADLGDLYLQGEIKIEDADGNYVPYRIPENIRTLIPYENYSYGMNWAIEMRPGGFKAPFTIKQLASTAKRTDDVFDFEIQQEDFDKPQKSGKESIWLYAHDLSRSFGDYFLKAMTVNIQREIHSSAHFYSGPYIFDGSLDLWDPESGTFLPGFEETVSKGDFLTLGSFGAKFNGRMPLDQESYRLRVSKLLIVDKTFELSTTWMPDEALLSAVAEQSGQSEAIISYESFVVPDIDPEKIPQGLILGFGDTQKTLELKDLQGNLISSIESDYGSFSFEGRKLVYARSAREGEGQRELVALDIATKEITALTRLEDDNVYMPRWSPDGNCLAYHGDNNGLYIFNVENKQFRVISMADPVEILGWSDENELYISEHGYGNGKDKLYVYTVELDNTREVIVPGISVWGSSYPTISRFDGLMVANNATGDELYVWQPGTEQPRLIVEGFALHSFGWFDQGWVIVSLRIRETQSEITVLINVDSGEIIRIPTVPGVPFDITPVKQ